MNYIKRLEKEKEDLAKRVETLENGLLDILAYAQSVKFYENEYIHKNDIVLRIRELV